MIYLFVQQRHRHRQPELRQDPDGLRIHLRQAGARGPGHLRHPGRPVRPPHPHRRRGQRHHPVRHPGQAQDEDCQEHLHRHTVHERPPTLRRRNASHTVGCAQVNIAVYDAFIVVPIGVCLS